MAKTRKMLGKIDDPVVIQIMRVIETQSKKTLTKWTTNLTRLLSIGIADNGKPFIFSPFYYVLSIAGLLPEMCHVMLILVTWHGLKPGGMGSIPIP